jgi:dTDP-4-dehydrorhamnose reductase
MSQEIVLTGANGQIGSWLRQSLRQPNRRIRLLDNERQRELEPGEQGEVITASVTDLDAMVQACEGADVIVHLGGLSTGGYSWQQYLEVNVNGTFCVLEAARRAGVARVVYASSHHAAGFYSTSSGVEAPDYLFPRPDTLYGVSKVAGESLCSLYHDRYGLDAVCLRIGSYRPRPSDQRALWNWLSPGDCTRLFEAAIACPSPGYRVVWGISANSRRKMSLGEAGAIGYFPVDDAEDYVDEIPTPPPSDISDSRDLLGGPYTDPTFE